MSMRGNIQKIRAYFLHQTARSCIVVSVEQAMKGQIPLIFIFSLPGPLGYGAEV